MATVLELRQAGFDDTEIQSHIQTEGQKLSQAGFSQKDINKHFGTEQATQPQGVTSTGITSVPLQDEGPTIGPAPERGFFEGGRAPLPPNADRLEKLDRVFDVAVGTPLRVFIKFAKGRTFNLPDLMWAGLKKITPDDMWDSDVKKMTLDQAMDWASGNDPSGFEQVVGNIAEFAGRLQTASLIGTETGILAKELPKGVGVLGRALESAKLFGLGETGRQLQRLLSETVDPETDYQYEGAIAVIKDFVLGGSLSLGNSLIARPALAKAAQTGVGKAIIETYDRTMIEITKRFPVLVDVIRKNPSKEVSKLVNEQFRARGIDPEQFTTEQKAVANHIARELEKRFVRAAKNFKPTEDIIRAKPKPKLLPGEVKPPAEAAITVPKPPPVQLKVEKPPIVPPKAEIAPPTEKEVIIEKPIEVKTKIPKTPKEPVTESPTISLKGKEAQVFREEVRTQEKITAAEAGEVGIEPAGVSFTDHIDTFHSYQLPETSKIPRITKQMKKINGLRLAGKITPQQANRRIHKLRQLVISQAIKEKIALRVNKKGKVKIALRESGVFVPEEVATYKKYKDIEPILGGGQDITRAIQQMDGSLTIKEKLQTKGQAGPIEKFVLFRSRKMQLQKLNWLKEKTIELQSILEAKKGSKKDKEINLILEKIGTADRNVSIKKIIDKKTLASFSKESIKAAQELRQFYDDLIEEQNTARTMRGQDEIPYRQNYSPNILRDTTVWEQLFLRDKTAKVLEKKDLPDYIKPNAPFNPRAQAREADIPYDKRILSSRELAESYTITAAKDIFNTSIIQNNKAFIDQLKGQGLEKTANYLGEWTATSFAGIKPRLDRAIKLPKWAAGSLRYFNRLRNMAVFPFNVAWSLSTQPLSLANTIGRYGLPNTIRGFFQWLQPSIRKQAAQDYFSFIVKTTKRGGVTKQDASNLLGDNIKIQKTVGEFAENFSTILLTEMEKLLTGASIRAAHIQGKKRGLTGEALKNFASDGGGKTQSMYNDEDKPMILRSLLVKSAAPYQTYAFEVANTFREWAGKTGTPPDSKLYAMWSVTRWLAAMTVLRMLANRVRGKQWSWWDLIPIPFREFWLSPIARKLTGEFLPGSSGLPSPVETGTRIAQGINDVFETGNWRRLRNVTLKYVPGIVKIPGGVQISRIVDAIITYASGGLTDRRGRVMFEMKDPIDLARAMFTGVWTTKEAQALLKKRQKKQTPKSGFDIP